MSALTADEIRAVGVLGAGTMGNGIAHAFARGGYDVILYDVETDFLDRAMETISKNLDREVKKGKLTETQKPAVLARILASTDLAEIARCQLAVEAVPENVAVKTGVLRDADNLLPTQAILATNTSSISVTQLAAGTARPDRFLGMHFMNPVPVMPLVEVIRALQTSDATFEAALQVCKKLGKTPVAVNDAPGFVSNRVLMPLINEAAFVVMEGVAAPEAVDAVMKLGMNHPMGPLELADFIGLDVCVNILDVLYTGFGDSKYRVCPLLRKMIAAGRLGRKSGQGFYPYGK